MDVKNEMTCLKEHFKGIMLHSLMLAHNNDKANNHFDPDKTVCTSCQLTSGVVHYCLSTGNSLLSYARATLLQISNICFCPKVTFFTN